MSDPATTPINQIGLSDAASIQSSNSGASVEDPHATAVAKGEGGSTGSRVSKKHLKMGVVALAVLALIIGLSVGLSSRNNNSSNVSASAASDSAGVLSAIDECGGPSGSKGSKASGPPSSKGSKAPSASKSSKAPSASKSSKAPSASKSSKSGTESVPSICEEIRTPIPFPSPNPTDGGEFISGKPTFSSTAIGTPGSTPTVATEATLEPQLFDIRVPAP